LPALFVAVNAGWPLIAIGADHVFFTHEQQDWGWGALVRALEGALATPDARLGEMGRVGSAHVAARFAPRPTHVIDQIVAVYDELLAAGAPA